MRIVIVNAFERGNRGDAVLLSVMIDQLREAHPGASIAIAGFEDPRRHSEFEGTPNLGSIRRFTGEEGIGRARRVMRKVLAAAVMLLAAAGPTRRLLVGAADLLPAEVRRELLGIAQSDLVVALGGGYLNARDDTASDLSIFFLLLPLWLAQRFTVSVVLGPQSYGPFPRPRQRAMVRHVLSHARLVMVREDISLAYLEQVGVPPAQIVRAVDSAFAFAGRSRRPWRRELDVPPDETLVVLTARQWLSPEKQEEYERSLVAALRHILRHKDHHVVLVPQVTCAFQNDDDRLVNSRLATQVNHPRLRVITDDVFDHHDAYGIYASADYIVGTRFHSVIFGLTAAVPCVAIEYEHKTRGIMRELGLEEWVIGIEESRPELLIGLIDRLFASREIYVARLRAELPGYIRRCDAAVPLLASSVVLRSAQRAGG